MPEQFITCPNCGEKIPITKAFTHDIEERLRAQFDGEMKKLEKQHADRLRAKEKELEQQLEKQRATLEKQAQSQAEKVVSMQLQDLKSQLQEKDDEIERAQKQELSLRKRVRQIQEREKALELEIERKLDAERKVIWGKASKQAEQEHQLKDAEKDKQIGDMRAQIAELKRKAEQGSQQMQGEVLELQLEEKLRTFFQFDTTEEVSKGARGADVLQVVRNGSGEMCGKILWEAKNAKNWSNGWIQKLSDDQRDAKADIAVIVTTALPKDAARVSQVKGVWVADVESAMGLATVLRQFVIEQTQARKALVGKNTKMEAMYNYLSGPEFRQRVESIVSSFTAMQDDLNAEKRAMVRAWGKREKQISRVIENTAHMYGDLQGMIGASLPEMKILELPVGELPEE